MPVRRLCPSGALRQGDQHAAAPPPSEESAQLLHATQESGVVNTQPVSFPIRLPDALQEEAQRLLGASRAATSELLVELWPALDRFAAERTGPAWKQVERYAARRSGHGRRPRALRDGAGGTHSARPGHAQAGLC